MAEHLAAQLGVGVDGDVRPRLWAKVGLACFFSAFGVWVELGGELSDHIGRALASVPSPRSPDPVPRRPQPTEPARTAASAAMTILPSSAAELSRSWRGSTRTV